MKDIFVEGINILRKMGATNESAFKSETPTTYKSKPHSIIVKGFEDSAVNTAPTAFEGEKEGSDQITEGDLVKEQVKTTIAESKFEILKWVILVVLTLFGLFYGLISHRFTDIKDDFIRSFKELKEDMKILNDKQIKTDEQIRDMNKRKR